MIIEFSISDPALTWLRGYCCCHTKTREVSPSENEVNIAQARGWALGRAVTHLDKGPLAALNTSTAPPRPQLVDVWNLTR